MNDQHQADKRNFKRVFLTTLQKNFFRIFLDLDQHSKHFFVHRQKQTSCKICFQKAENQDERLENFDMKKIMSIFNKVFTAEQHFKVHKQNLSLLLKTIQDLMSHSYKAEFMKAQQAHLESHCQMQMFYEMN